MISALKESNNNGDKLTCKSVTQKALYSRNFCTEDGFLTDEGKVFTISLLSLKKQAETLLINVKKLEYGYDGYPNIKVKNYMDNFYDHTNPEHYKVLVNYELLKTKIFPEIFAGNTLLKDKDYKLVCFDEGKSIFILLTCMCYSELSKAWNDSGNDLSGVKSNLHSIKLLSLMNSKKGFYEDLSENLLNAVKCAKIEDILIAFDKIKYDYNELIIDTVIDKNCIGISKQFIKSLYHSLGNDILIRIMKIYLIDPNTFGKGWPDITAIKINNTVKLIEIKTSDKLHVSQINTFLEIKKIIDIEIIKVTKVSA